MQRSTKQRAISTLVRNSASLNREFWKEPIARPNALRCLTYPRVISSASSQPAIAVTASVNRSGTSRPTSWKNPTLFTEQVLRRNAHVAEEQLGRVRGVLAELLDLL